MIRVRVGDCKEHIPRIVELAEKVYASEDVSPIQRYLGFYTVCPQSYITAYDSKGILSGYIIAIPVDEDYFEETTRPDYKEQELFSTVSKQYTVGANKLYLFSIVVQPDHAQRVQILGALAREFVKLLKYHAKNGKFVTEISALALSDSGQKICRGIDMFEVAKNEKGTVFVNRSFTDVYLEQGPGEDSVMGRLIRPRY